MGSRTTARAFVALSTAAVVVAALASPAAAAPVCAEEPRTACGGRIFPEAEMALSFLQHDNGEFEAGIKALERDYPRFVKVTKFTDLLGNNAVSVEGRDMWLIEITDFNAPEEGKIPVAVSLSVHGFERAGQEGGARYAEDLARWAKEDPDHELRNGTNPDSIGVPISEALEKVHIYLANINPDGWAAGDVANGGVYSRGNGNGVDLNREFPTIGWSYPPYTALSEPESKAWNELMQRIKPRVTADLHGELTSANNAFADIMLPAGQWDPVEQAQEDAMARHMKSNIARYFEQDGVTADDASGMKPAEYATGFDVVGYDAAGFMGDWFTQEFGAVDLDVEHFLSHVVPNSTWVSGLEKAHIAAVRGEIETLIVEALVVDDVSVRLELGRTGFFDDPAVVTSADGYGGPKPPKEITPKPYRATRMRYLRDLSRHATRAFTALGAGEMARGGLRGLDNLVLADKPFGDRLAGKPGLRRRVLGAIREWVQAGGNLILTDRAVKLLAGFDLVARKSIKKRLYTAGHINIHDFSDPYTKDVHHTASQTYYEVPLGFSLDRDTSPHYIVKRRALKKAKGKAVAHIEEEKEIGLGRVGLGRGTVGFIGALLPQPTERFDHFYGLADYAVSVAGGQILNNMLRF